MLDPDTRRRHLYVFGQTSAGKSTLLLNLIALPAGASRCSTRAAILPTVLLHVPRNRSNVIM